MNKPNVTLNGKVAYISCGGRAWIDTGDNSIIRTSRVESFTKHENGRYDIVTMNTHYHVIPEGACI